MRTQFERQLEELHVELIKMGGLCEEAIRLLYGDFVRQYRKMSGAFVKQVQATEGVRAAEGKELILMTAVVSSLAKDMTQFLLQDGEKAEKPEK